MRLLVSSSFSEKRSTVVLDPLRNQRILFFGWCSQLLSSHVDYIGAACADHGAGFIEMGAGSGWLAFLLKDRGYEVDAYDNTEVGRLRCWVVSEDPIAHADVDRQHPRVLHSSKTGGCSLGLNMFKRDRLRFCNTPLRSVEPSCSVGLRKARRSPLMPCVLSSNSGMTAVPRNQTATEYLCAFHG